MDECIGDGRISSARGQAVTRRRRNVVRGLVLIIITSLLALVTTVAVSWCCALWVETFANIESVRWGGSDLRLAADSRFNYWGVAVNTVPGGTGVLSSWRDEDLDGRDSRDPWPNQLPKDVLPRWWGDSMRPEVTNTSGQMHERWGEAWGWPFNAMWTKSWSRESSTFDRIHECAHCFRVRQQWITGWKHDRVLPLAIIWQGFALNMLLYWAAWLVLYLMFVLTVGGAQRSVRRRKGRCTKCGYDLQGSAGERCPECGTAT